MANILEYIPREFWVRYWYCHIHQELYGVEDEDTRPDGNPCHCEKRYDTSIAQEDVCRLQDVGVVHYRYHGRGKFEVLNDNCTMSNYNSATIIDAIP
jgi:hypothetical protein